MCIVVYSRALSVDLCIIADALSDLVAMIINNRVRQIQQETTPATRRGLHSNITIYLTEAECWRMPCTDAHMRRESIASKNKHVLVCKWIQTVRRSPRNGCKPVTILPETTWGRIKSHSSVTMQSIDRADDRISIISALIINTLFTPRLSISLSYHMHI